MKIYLSGTILIFGLLDLLSNIIFRVGMFNWGIDILIMWGGFSLLITAIRLTLNK